MRKCDEIHRALRRCKAAHPDAIVAIGVGDYLLFIKGEAHELNGILPDERIVRDGQYDKIRIHVLRFFPLMNRVKAAGRKIAVVRRDRSGYSLDGVY